MKDDLLRSLQRIILSGNFGRTLLAGIFLMLQLNLFAQQKSISGTVTEIDNVALPGVTVMIKGTSLGTLTNSNGEFTINVPESGAVLVVSFIGYETQEVTVNASSIYSIKLSQSTTALEEVVVVGYGTQKKESVVGAITQVGSASLQKTAAVNVTNAIAGKLSGIFTNQRRGEPGLNQSEIIVRGLSSWNGSQPLTLVDGVERDFSNIDPNEIENISVLKDASATAVFGARGANGVILVTTRRGTTGKPKMDFTSSYGFTNFVKIPQFIDSYTTMSTLNVALKNTQRYAEIIPDNILGEYRNPSTPLNSLRYPNVNWWDLLVRPRAPVYNANFNVQGGTNFVKYFTSIGYNYEGSNLNAPDEGYMDTRYWFKKFNYRANLDFLLSKTTTLSFNLGGVLGIKNQPSNNNGFWKAINATGPSRMPAYFPEWALDLIPDPDYPDFREIRFANKLSEVDANPYTILNSISYNRYVNSDLNTDLYLNQKLDFIVKGLSANGKVAFSTSYINRELTASWSKPDYLIDWNKVGVPGANPWVQTGGGVEVWKMNPFSVSTSGLQDFIAVDRFAANNIDGFATKLYYEGSLDYTNNFGKNNVQALVLASRTQNNRKTDFPYYNAAFVGRVSYNYAMKYLLEINAGYTGSEAFAPGNRYGFFPSAAVGWVISEENFFKNAVPWMNKLKIRYSDGLVGSDAASSRWLYISEYAVSGEVINESSAANPYAQWEEARKRDIGIEIGVFKNLLTFGVDLFDEQRSKMLVSPVVTMLVGNSYKDLNLGSLKKHGIELEAEFNKTTVSGFNYFIKGIFAFNENRVITRNDAIFTPEYKKAAGKPLNPNMLGDGTFTVASTTDLIDNRYFASVDDIHGYLSPTTLSYESLVIGDYKFLDYTADGILDGTDTYYGKGSYYPPITASLSSGFSYKNFSFNFVFSGAAGKWVNVSNYFETPFTNGNWKIKTSNLDYWTPTNQDAKQMNISISGFTYEKVDWMGRGIVDNYWRNSDYIRLKEVYLGYTLNPAFLKRTLGVSGLQVYLNGYNLLTFTKLLKDLDPEVMRTQDWNSGFYPQTSTIRAGIKLNF